MSPSPRTALVVDDDADMRRVIEVALACADCQVVVAESAKQAIDRIDEHRFFVAFVDARLPDMDGWLLVDELRRSSPQTRIIMISGYYFADDVCVVDALQSSKIDGFLAKPFWVEAILAAVERQADEETQPQEGGR